MKKINIEKSSVTLSNNVNKKNISLNAEKMDPLKKDILKNLEVIYKCFGELDSLLNKMALKKSFNDEYNALAQQCAKKCVSQAQSVRSLIENLENRYNDDYKTVLIQDLDSRISDIEKRLSTM